jgi:hypothetical protein
VRYEETPEDGTYQQRHKVPDLNLWDRKEEVRTRSQLGRVVLKDGRCQCESCLAFDEETERIVADVIREVEENQE